MAKKEKQEVKQTANVELRSNLHKPSRLQNIRSTFDQLGVARDFYYSQEITQPAVHLGVKANRQRVAHHSDDHLAHAASESKMTLAEFEDDLIKPGQSANFYDDMVEGHSNSGGSHDATTTQPALMKAGKAFKLHAEMLEELHAAGRLGVVVDGTLQHGAGWPKEMGEDPYEDVPCVQGRLIDNGGDVVYHYPDGGKETIVGFHNAGGGGSDQNPLAAAKLRLMDHEGDGTTVVTAHNHTRHSWEQHVDEKGKIVFTGMALGTKKGINKDKPDPFLRDKAVTPKGSGAHTVHVEIDGERVVIPALNQRKSDMVWDGYELLEEAEHRGLTSEVIEQMGHNLDPNGPQVTFERFGTNDSRIKPNYDGDKGATKHWEQLVYSASTSMPVLLKMVNLVRYGASTSNVKLLREQVIEPAKRDPNTFIIFLRKLLSEDTPTSPVRAERVKNLLAILAEAPGLNEVTGKASTLAVLWDELLQKPDWLEPVGPTETTEDKKKFGKLKAASLINEVTGAPMLSPNGDIIIETGAGKYSISVQDKLGGRMALDKPGNGLYAQERTNRLQGAAPHDIVVGGHGAFAMNRVTGSVKSVGEQTLMAPGGYAEWVERGRGNARMPSAPGQAAILTTYREKHIFPTPNHQVTEELYKVISLEQGAEQTGGVEDWKKRLGRRKKKHFTL